MIGVLENKYCWIFSPLLLALAFGAQDSFFWCSFIFLIPLFLSVQHCSWWQGVSWGIIYYSIHFVYVVALLYEKAQGEWRLICYPMIVVYMASYAGIWFFASHNASHYVTILYGNHVWPFFTIMYFIINQQLIFWIFDIAEGYPFSLPIIPLTAHPSLLHPVSYIGVYGMTACLIYWQWFLVQWIQKRKRIALLLSGVFLVPFIIGIWYESEDREYEWASDFVYCSLAQCEQSAQLHPLDWAQEIAYLLQRGVEQHYDKSVCFVMPESAFPFCVQKSHTALWQAIFDNNKQQLVLGAYIRSENKSKNSIIQLNKCRIIQTYEKKHATIFTERVPFYIRNYGLFSNLFGGKTDRRTNKRKDTTNYHYVDTQNTEFYSLLSVFSHYYLPVLCSELFFNGFSSLPFKNEPILLLCNDGWFAFKYIQKLMLNYAQLYAKTFDRAILFISHNRGAFISQTGRVQDLLTIA